MKARLTMIISLTLVALALLLGLRIGRKKTNNSETMKTETVDSTKVADRVLNLIILDESGSMSGLEKVSVDGVNETIQTIKSSYEQLPEQKQLITFVTFSDKYGKPYRKRFELADISTVDTYQLSEYQPGGTTPLYDTMGDTLTELEKVATENDIVLVTIITDGYENSSREYDAEKIRELVKRLDEKDWVFTYIGANQDAILEARKIGINNAMNYDADEDGTREMWEKEKVYRSRFMESARIGTSRSRLKAGYFSNEEKDTPNDK